MHRGNADTETHTVCSQCFLSVPPKGCLEKQLWPLGKVGRSEERLTGREVGQPKGKQQDSVKSDSHQETWLASEGEWSWILKKERNTLLVSQKICFYCLNKRCLTRHRRHWCKYVLCTFKVFVMIRLSFSSLCHIYSLLVTHRIKGKSVSSSMWGRMTSPSTSLLS